MLSQWAILFPKLFYSSSNCSADVYTCAFGDLRCPAIATTEAHGSGKLPAKGLDFCSRLFRPFAMACFCRVFQLLAEFGQAAAVRCLGLRVEHLTRVVRYTATQTKRGDFLTAEPLGGPAAQRTGARFFGSQ